MGWIIFNERISAKIAAYFSLNLTFLNNLTFDLANVETKYIIGDIFFRIPHPSSTHYMYAFNMTYPMTPPPPPPPPHFAIKAYWTTLDVVVFKGDHFWSNAWDSWCRRISDLNPSTAGAPTKTEGRKYFGKPSNPCHVGIHWIALAEYSQMSIHVPGFQSFLRILHYFVLAKLATSGKRVNAIKGC